MLAYIAQTEKDYDTAETEFRKVLLLDPEQAGTSYQLGATILRQMATNNELTRYSEAIYDFARSLAITGPNALAPEEKAAAESALKESYGSYHGSTDGLDELMRQVGASALPPPGFHIVSIGESQAFHRRTMIGATVVSQPSVNRLIVRLDDAPGGDAILTFDGDHIGAIRPGTRIQFTGIVDSWTPEPYVLTFVIRDPHNDIVGLTRAGARPHNILARTFKGLLHLLRRIA